MDGISLETTYHCQHIPVREDLKLLYHLSACDNYPDLLRREQQPNRARTDRRLAMRLLIDSNDRRRDVKYVRFKNQYSLSIIHDNIHMVSDTRCLSQVGATRGIFSATQHQKFKSQRDYLSIFRRSVFLNVYFIMC